MDKKKILLLNVNSTTFYYDQIIVPFGLVSIGSYLDNEKFEIIGIDINSNPQAKYLQIDDELLEKIITINPILIGMTTYASSIYNALFWADVLKSKLPDSKIILGGNHASYIAKECLEKYPGVDMVVRFEGEIPFRKICDKLLHNDNNFSDVPNLTYRDKGTIKETPLVDLIEDIGSLPPFNRTFFSSKSDHRESLTHADIVSARGCPFHCTFCNCNHFWKKKYRVRRPEAVIQELQELKDAIPKLKTVRFRDESVTINKKHCLKLCSLISDSNLNLKFHAHSRLDGLDEELIQALAKAGFELLFLGLESGSEKVLKQLKKGINISKAYDVVPLLRKYHIKFRASFMSATPGGGFKETLKTVRLIKALKLKKDEFYVGYGVQIYPGTRDYDKFKELNPDYEWLIKDYSFKGKYYPVKDIDGNILFPIYKEFFPITFAFIYFLLDPYYSFKIVIGKIKRVFFD